MPKEQAILVAHALLKVCLSTYLIHARDCEGEKYTAEVQAIDPEAAKKRFIEAADETVTVDEVEELKC